MSPNRALAGLLVLLPAMAAAQAAPRQTPQQSGTTLRLQAITPVTEQLVWASGAGGRWAVTTDGGTTWRSGTVPGADSLEFRDVQGVSEREAFLMSAGNGPASRIYHTADAGATWTLQFQNADSAAFYDCFAFWDARRAIVMSDASTGRFPARRTTDGATWADIGDRMPKAQEGEGAFAASGTCVATHGKNDAWIITGAAPRSRVLHTTDGGDSWVAYETPIVQGMPVSGGFSIAFRSSGDGILVGGDLNDNGTTQNVAVTGDGGRTWTLRSPTPFPGAAFGVAYVPGAGKGTVVATGPGGAAWSTDEGRTWTLIDGAKNYWAVAAAGRTAWLVGTGGRILRLDL
jgi:photosystem II stability/assembly factor-like uncharacterized protein